MKKYLPGIILLLCGFAVLAGDQPDAARGARRKNPTLKISAWTGSETMRERLKQDLLYADWFELTDGRDADYYLEGNSSKNGTKLSLELILKRPDGALKLKRSSDTSNENWLVHSSVDDLIQKTFKNPGFCATQLAFVKAKDKSKEVWLSEFDGSGGYRLSNNKSISTEPAWSRDNRYLSYTLYEPNSTSIIVLDLVANRHKRLASYPGLNAGCAIANNSLWVAMILSESGYVDLYLKHLNSGKIERLTADELIEASPCWSPDDKTICFARGAGARPRLFLRAVAGGAPKLLIKLNIEAMSPDWSPVSNKICFATRQGTQFTIAEVDMNRKKRQIKLLVNAEGNWETPSWTADGRHLVCRRNYKGRKTFYLVDSWYGTLRELKTGPGVSLPACSNRY